MSDESGVQHRDTRQFRHRFARETRTEENLLGRRYAPLKEKEPARPCGAPSSLAGPRGIYERGDSARIDDRYTSRSYPTGVVRETDLRTDRAARGIARYRVVTRATTFRGHAALVEPRAGQKLHRRFRNCCCRSMQNSRVVPPPVIRRVVVAPSKLLVARREMHRGELIKGERCNQRDETRIVDQMCNDAENHRD